MRAIAGLRDPALARRVAASIGRQADRGRTYRFMEFCGSHTEAICRHGLEDLLPPNVKLVHGPGCPVCVLPAGRIDQAVRLALEPGIVLATYGDVLRVPGSGPSLAGARALGADARMVYSPLDALRIAAAEPDRMTVFFAAGFETTTPPTALALHEARRLGLSNFLVWSNHLSTPAGLQHLLESPELRRIGTPRLDGFLGPGHVSLVIGSRPYEYFAEEYRRPVVIAGFEPLDVLLAIRMLVRQVDEGRHAVENEYVRAVTREGNRSAQALVAEVFELRRVTEWRGLGPVPYGGLRLRREFAAFDAEARFELPEIRIEDPPGCRCGAILRGLAEPEECPRFGRSCVPESPIGPCMVSSEGACAARYAYRRFA